MSDELNRVYEALQKADQAGNAEDAKQLASYARQLESQQTKEPKEKTVDAKLNDIMYPAAGAVAGASLGTASGAGRMLYGGAKAAAQLANPEAMAAAKLQADKNAVETWARTQNRVPGMVAEKPGLYFGQPRYDLEAAMAKQEMSKMMADPDYHAKVVSEQKPSVSAYEKRVAAANPSTMQKVGRTLAKAPMDFIAGPLAGLGAGFQASDAVNRYNQGDKLGSAISGVGAVGSGLAMIPHPVTRLGGTAVGIGAEGLNAYIDFLKKNNPFDKLIQQAQQPQQQQAQQPQPQQQPRQMAEGGSVKHYEDGGPVSGLSGGPIADLSIQPMQTAFQATSSPIADLSSQPMEMYQTMSDQQMPIAMPFTGAMDQSMFNQPMNTPLASSMNPNLFRQFNLGNSANYMNRALGGSSPMAMAGASSLQNARPFYPTALSRPPKSNYVAINRNLQPRAPRRRFSEGGKIESLMEEQQDMKHFAVGGLSVAPVIKSGQITAAPTPIPLGFEMPPQGMPTQAALQAWQNAGSPSVHNFFGSDTPTPAAPTPAAPTPIALGGIMPPGGLGALTPPTQPPMPQGMPTQEALKAWQDAGSPSNHNFFGSDTPNGPMPEPQVQPSLPTQPLGTSPLPRPQPSVVSQREQVMAAIKTRHLEKLAQQKAEQQARQQRVLEIREAQRQKALAEQQARKQKLLDNKNQIKTGSYTAPEPRPQPPTVWYGK